MMEIYKLKFEHYVEDNKNGRHEVEEPLVVQTAVDHQFEHSQVNCVLNILLDQMFDRLRKAALKR